MLDRPRNPECHVQLRCNHLPSLPNLQRVVRVSGVHGRTRRTNRGPEGVCERVERVLERLRVLERTAAGDDAACDAKIRPIRLRQRSRNMLCWCVRDLDGVNRLHGDLRAIRGPGGGERGRPDGEELHGNGGRRTDGRNGIASVDGPRECGAVIGRVVLDRGDVGDSGGVKSGCNSGKQGLCRGRMGGYDVCKCRIFGKDLLEQW